MPVTIQELHEAESLQTRMCDFRDRLHDCGRCHICLTYHELLERYCEENGIEVD